MRQALRKRPLCFGCGLFLILLYLSVYTEWRYALTAGIISMALLLLCLMPIIIRTNRLKTISPLIAGGLLAAAAAFLTAHCAVQYGYHRLTDPLEGQSGQAVVVVTRPTGSTVYSASCEGKLISLNGDKIELNGIFYFPYEASLKTGDRLLVNVTLSPIRERTDGLAGCYSLSQGLYFTANAEDLPLLKTGETKLFPHSLRQTLRDILSARLLIYLPSQASALADALLLGDKTELDTDLRQAFQHLGISHTLAVSGLHLGILLGGLSLLFKKLHIPRRLHLWLLFPPSILYVLLVGSPSVLRAGGMLFFLLLAHPFGRRRDPLTSLFAVVSLICLISPFSVLDIGLLLSFSSTFGILLIGLPLAARCRSFPKPLTWLFTSLSLTASALTFTLPFSIWYFGEISLLSPLSNLLFVPLITLLLYLLPILLLLSPFPVLAATPAYAARLLSKLTASAAYLLGSDDQFMLSLSPTLIRTAGLIWLAGCIGFLCFRKTRPAVLICTALFLLFSGGYLWFHTVQIAEDRWIYAYSDGQNDALLLHAGTRVMICDASNGSYRFLSAALTLAESDPSVRADSLLLTHYHSLQLSSLPRLLSNSHIEYLILPLPDADHANLAATLAERAIKAGCKVQYYSPEECMVSYHTFQIIIDTDSQGAHPLNDLTVQEKNIKTVFYYTDSSNKPLNGEQIYLPASHSSKLPADDSAWNRRYD